MNDVFTVSMCVPHEGGHVRGVALTLPVAMLMGRAFIGAEMADDAGTDMYIRIERWALERMSGAVARWELIAPFRSYREVVW